MTATIPSSLRGYTEPLPSVAWGAVSVLAWSRFLFSQPLLTSFWVWHGSLTYSACLGIHYFLVSGSLLLFAEYSQSLKMWLLKFHFKDSRYQLIFIGVLPPSALGCRKPPAGENSLSEFFASARARTGPGTMVTYSHYFRVFPVGLVLCWIP